MVAMSEFIVCCPKGLVAVHMCIETARQCGRLTVAWLAVYHGVVTCDSWDRVPLALRC